MTLDPDGACEAETGADRTTAATISIPAPTMSHRDIGDLLNGVPAG
jgi:hypothetical protein